MATRRTSLFVKGLIQSRISGVTEVLTLCLFWNICSMKVIFVNLTFILKNNTNLSVYIDMFFYLAFHTMTILNIVLEAK